MRQRTGWDLMRCGRCRVCVWARMDTNTDTGTDTDMMSGKG